jgi:hypothetical protein
LEQRPAYIVTAETGRKLFELDGLPVGEIVKQPTACLVIGSGKLYVHIFGYAEFYDASGERVGEWVPNADTLKLLVHGAQRRKQIAEQAKEELGG